MNKQIVPFFLITLVTGFTLVVGISIYRGHLMYKEYPKLLNRDALNDTVTLVIHEGRGGARVTLQSKRKITLPWARNYQYTIKADLTRMIQEGDILLKKHNSDTLKLIRSDKSYVFVLYKTIR